MCGMINLYEKYRDAAFGGFSSKNRWDAAFVNFSKLDFEELDSFFKSALHAALPRAIAGAYALEVIRVEGNGSYDELLKEYKDDMLDEDTRRTIDVVNYELLLADLKASAENAFREVKFMDNREAHNNVFYTYGRLRTGLIIHARNNNVFDRSYRSINIGPRFSFDPKGV